MTITRRNVLLGATAAATLAIAPILLAFTPEVQSVEQTVSVGILRLPAHDDLLRCRARESLRWGSRR